ncbi:L-threonine ammonia-lyase [[Leptolyngbya] sp. PCC 7376]|uniref:threonine ammonia-lyase n=1 Tax=[Leptolyngbya] sp. PCC 7376 TaxID=111781 RepID=UPI00029F23D6|nr:threonine ammonia-lyase [[Leptolyngbya] sp. PCC 7376]AFY36879.1 L-threonine ammonia-lyase [[Leptolyngbya] sp. PCC 7376]
MTVTLQDIRKAAEIIHERVSNTPCRQSRSLSELVGTEVVLKFENLQFTGSFKERGALVKLLSLNAAQREKGIVAMSAGNHAQAVAYQSKQLGIPATIVMPKFTPNIKVERTRAFGAEVIFHGDTLDDSIMLGQKLAHEQGLQTVHPYDDERIIAGQGTITLEMLTVYPELDVLLVPVGGGGLIGGNAIAAKSIKPEIKIIGVQTQRFPSMFRALQGELAVCGSSTIAEGIAVKSPGQLTLPIAREWVNEILLVSEAEIENAVRFLLEREKTVVEGAGAVGVAALMKYGDRFSDQSVGIILSGGNIDLPILSRIVQRGLVRSGRLVRLDVDVKDLPGGLAGVSQCIGDAGANIIEVQHQRAFTSLPLQSVNIQFVLQTRGTEHLQQIIAALLEQGYPIHTSQQVD